MVEKNIKKKTTKKVVGKVVKKPSADDKASALYEKRNKTAGIDKEIYPLAMWGFIASLSPLVIAFIPLLNFFTPFLPIAGIILSAIGLHKLNQQSVSAQYKGRSFAIAGIIVGIVMIFLIIALVIAFITIMTHIPADSGLYGNSTVPMFNLK